MPPPCHNANTPGASGAAATSVCVNGRLALLIDMISSPRACLAPFYACSYGVDGDGAYMSNRFDTRETQHDFSRLPQQRHRHKGCRTMPTTNRKKAAHHAVETKWRFMPCARADYRRRRERPDPAVRV